jgi:hypothetical protein
VKTNGLPRGFAIKDDKTIVATNKCIEIIKNDDVIFTLDVSHTPTVIGINSDGSSVAVGSEVRFILFGYYNRVGIDFRNNRIDYS